jgi:hypothetical protein
MQEVRDRWYDLHQKVDRVVVSQDIYLKILEETSKTMRYLQPNYCGLPTLVIAGPVGMVPVLMDSPKDHCPGCGAPTESDKCSYCGRPSSFIHYHGF